MKMGDPGALYRLALTKIWLKSVRISSIVVYSERSSFVLISENLSNSRQSWLELDGGELGMHDIGFLIIS